MKSTVGDETHWLWLLKGKYLLVYLVLYEMNLNIFELFLLVTQDKQPVHVTLPLGFFFFFISTETSTDIWRKSSAPD